MNDQHGGDRTRSLQEDRDRAAAEGRPYAVVLECDLAWDFGAPSPTLLRWEHTAHLFFHLRDEDGIGRAAFDYCKATTFGPPGEDGHALEGSGWEAYKALRVIDSLWLAKMAGPASGLSHFLFSFHDSTFECLADSCETSRFTGSMSEALRATIDEWD